ncbi:MAG TPA: cytochrome P450 [Bryobacteraceae bacterium]|nr:cytochrome P450 [Bryobacteraceae bacterium]
MRQIPREEALDSTAAMLSEGYNFIRNRARRHGCDAFETRLMFSKAICMTGEDAAAAFYGSGDRFTRRGAIPPTSLMALTDYGSVQLLDGEAHRWRKQMFLSILNGNSVQRLGDLFDAEWARSVERWSRLREVVLLDEAHGVLCRAACAWAGLRLSQSELQDRTREFAAMVDGAGSAGPRNWRGLILRHRTERWAEFLIHRFRTGRLDVDPGAPLAVVASHRDVSGQLLPVGVAAVELINLLRPIVAIARFIMFAALELHQHPDCAARIRSGDNEYVGWFVHEVRRTAPFFAFIGGRSREAFHWKGIQIEKNAWVLLDLYGSNHDPRTWPDPEAFRPERFSNWDNHPFRLVPQGGGDHATGHRCA